MKRDAFGLLRVYTDGTRHASTIRELLAADRSLDAVAVDAFLRGTYVPDRTMFAAVRQLPPSGPGEPSREPFGERLVAAVRRAVESAPRPLAVALSGGLDSAVILGLVRRVDPGVRAIVLDPQVPDYGELDAADRTARDLHIECDHLRVGLGLFAQRVRDAIGVFETPLYNLHPVSKWWLASLARAHGFASVISGDGADQLFRHDVSADYLPLVGSAFDAHGVRLYAPFLDVGAVDRDPDKQPVREIAATLPIRDELVRGPKVSRLAPPLPFDAPVERLARMLGRPLLDVTDDRDRVRWGTLALLVDSFEAWT